jgi:hypothetical protein
MGVVLFIVASAVVAGRLLVIYKRLQQPPELFLGLAYLLAGALGWGGLLIGTLSTPKGQTVAEAYQAWSVVVGDLGTFCFYLFIWYVFRRESLGAKVALGAVAAVFVLSIVRDTILRGVTFGPPPGSFTTLAAASGRTAVFAWMAAEAFSSYAAFRRRARIGLGNARVQNRLLMWGVSAVVMFTISAVATSLYLTATDTADATLKQNQAGAAYGLLAAVSSVALWLAVFPPKFYERWLDSSLPQEPSNG